MKLVFLVLVLYGPRIGYSGPVTTARIARCDELVGLGGRIYTIAEYMHDFMGMECHD